MRSLAEQGIDSRHYFEPVHLQGIRNERPAPRIESLSVTESIGCRTAALPFYIAMTVDDLDRVIAACREALRC